MLDDAARSCTVADMTPHLTIEETVKRLRVSRTTVYALIGEGKLVRVKIGKRAFVTAASVEALLAGAGA